MIPAGYTTDEELDKFHQEIKQKIDQAVEYAENSPEPDASEVTEFVYA